MTPEFKAILIPASEAIKQRLSKLHKDKNIGELEYQEVMGWVEHPDAALSQHGEALLCYAYLSIPDSQTEENKVADNRVSAHNQALWKHLNQLAEEGLAEAQFALGLMYGNGEGVAQNKVAAIRYYRRAADRGHADAQSILGVMYANKEVSTRDTTKILCYLQLAVERKKHAGAQFNLGLMYYDGDGVAQDKEKAAHYYHLAAEQGLADAQLNLGYMYSRGDGVAQDREKAFKYYLQAYQSDGSRVSEIILNLKSANMFAEAKELQKIYEQDYPQQARDERQKNAKKGDVVAQFELFAFWYQKQLNSSYSSHRQQRIKKLAMKWLEKATRIHAIAKYVLSLLHEVGKEVENPNKEEADKFLAESARQTYRLAQLMQSVKNLEEGDQQQAKEWFRQAVERPDEVEYEANIGDPIAQYNLGLIYDNGDGVAQDKEKAAHYYHLAAEQRHTKAQCNLGWMYDNGDGVKQDKEKAAHYYHLAADQGDADAQFNLGLMYSRGEGVAQDKEKAVHYYQLAAEQGHADAQYGLGNMYYYGDGVAQDKAKALHYYQLAAEQGNAGAQCNLGVMYYKGEDVAQDKEKTMHYLQLAAAQGYAKAQGALGWMYERGDGVAQDKEKAAHYYHLAAKQGVKKAEEALKQLLRTGEISAHQPNYSNTKSQFFNVDTLRFNSLSIGNQDSSLVQHKESTLNANELYRLGMRHKEGSKGLKQDKLKAMSYLVQAANQGHLFAQLNVAWMLNNGDGVKRDLTKAAHYFTLAAEQGDAIAQCRLAQMYLHGEGLEQDREKALHYFKQAAEQGDEDAQAQLLALESEQPIVSVSPQKKETSFWSKLKGLFSGSSR